MHFENGVDVFSSRRVFSMDLSLVDALNDTDSFFGDTDDVGSDGLDHSVVVTVSTPCDNGVTDVSCRQSDADADADADALITDPFGDDDLPNLPHPGSTPLDESHTPPPVPTSPVPNSSPLNHSQSPLSHAHSACIPNHSSLHQSHPSSPLQENVHVNHLSHHAAIAHSGKVADFDDDIFADAVLDGETVSALTLAHASRLENAYLNANAISTPTGASRPVTKDKLAQRKQRNKESARRYREKQVARRRHLENYTRTLCEQNRELESLHDRLLSLTCERSFALEARGPHSGDASRSMYAYGMQPASYSPSHATSPTTAYQPMHAALDHDVSASHAASPSAYSRSRGRSRGRTHSRSHSVAQAHAHADANAQHAAYLSTISSPSVSHDMQSTLLRQRSNNQQHGMMVPGSVHLQGRVPHVPASGEQPAHFARAMYVHASTTGFKEPIRTRPIAPSLAPSERQFATSGRL